MIVVHNLYNHHTTLLSVVLEFMWPRRDACWGLKGHVSSNFSFLWQNVAEVLLVLTQSCKKYPVGCYSMLYAGILCINMTDAESKAIIPPKKTWYCTIGRYFSLLSF